MAKPLPAISGREGFFFLHYHFFSFCDNQVFALLTSLLQGPSSHLTS